MAPRGRGAGGGPRVLDLNLQAVGRQREPLKPQKANPNDVLPPTWPHLLMLSSSIP